MNSNQKITVTRTRPSIVQRQEVIGRLLTAHGPKCGYCGTDLSFGSFQLDAYFPHSSNPIPPIENNYVLACPHCNMIKGARSPVSESGEILILHPYDERYWSEIKINKDGIAEGRTNAATSTIDIMHLNRPELVNYRQSHIGDYIDKIIHGSSAYEVYSCSISQLKELLELQISIPTLQEHFYRMVYANVISSMEAYLSKAFITIVLNDDTMFWQFVRRFDWNKEKVSMENIKEVYDDMNIRVQTKLTEVLYHNLPKVKAMYNKILDISILQDEAELTFLTRAVDIRHDLVHRNGRKSSSGTTDEYHNISLDMINTLISHVDLLINDIESQLP